MLKKAVLTVFAAMLIVFGASASFANQVDGMASGTGPALPAGLITSINPGGIGDTLLYGYYNARSGNINLFNIVNTSTTDGAAVRVVFRNGKNSKEVLDFTVCLSRGDVWTAFVIDDGTQGRIFSADSDTITAPVIPAAGQPFASGTFPFNGRNYVISADDTREGYFEAFGMTAILGYDKDTCVASGTALGRECAHTETLCRDFAGLHADVAHDVKNVLMGNNTIVDPNMATYSSSAVAFADWQITGFTTAAGLEPQLGNGSINLCAGIDFILTKAAIMTPYDVIANFGETEVVLNFPTRLVCHDGVNGPLATFNGSAASATAAPVYATTFAPTIWNEREKRRDVTDFSPLPQTTLPHEVNVLRVNGSKIWDSTLVTTIQTGDFTLGWLLIDLRAGDLNHQTTFGGQVALGLPAVAYVSQSYLDGDSSYMLPTAFTR